MSRFFFYYARGARFERYCFGGYFISRLAEINLMDNFRWLVSFGLGLWTQKIVVWCIWAGVQCPIAYFFFISVC